MDHVFNRRDIGYTIISRFEEAFRTFLGEALSIHFSDYQEGVPDGIITKAKTRATTDDWEDSGEFISDTDFPDLKEIVCHNQMYEVYFPQTTLERKEFEILMDNLYLLRNKIAHIRNHFSMFDLDKLLEGTKQVASQLEHPGEEFISFTKKLEEHPDEFVIPMPVEFSDSVPEAANVPNNIPIPDYEYEGGFVGRTDDIKKITKLLEGSRNVITISGAGGVGKTALALRVMQNLLQRSDQIFDGIVWLSAKETRLSYLGIEDIEPTVKNYEELLDAIFEVMGFGDPSASLEQKEIDVSTIFDLYKNILIVIDNLETITDDRITNFILDIEDTFPIVKILVTSRRGLGQVERRHELKQLKTKEAVNLFRRVARDKKLDDLAQIDEKVLEE
jgi:LuxR family glucitol operon transcriptional activator